MSTRDLPPLPDEDEDYFTLPSPRRASSSTSPSIPASPAAQSPSERYLEFVPRVSSPLTSPPLSPHGDTDAHYSDVFAALTNAEGFQAHGRRKKGRPTWVKDEGDVLTRVVEDDAETDEEGKRGSRISLVHISHRRLERLFHWRCSSTNSTPHTPPSDSDETSENEPDFGPPGIRQRRRRGYATEDSGDMDASEAEAMDLGASLRRELRERKHRRWDPSVIDERGGGGVTLAQLLAEELAFAQAKETMDERDAERARIERSLEVVVTTEKREVNEKDDFAQKMAGETEAEGAGGLFEAQGGSESGHGSAEGGSDESGLSAQSGSTDSSDETSDGHGILLSPGLVPRAKRGRSKLRRRRPPRDCVDRSRSEIPVRTRPASLSREEDGNVDVGCLPCSLGVRRSLRRLSLKLKIRRPEEIPPALQALVERPMSPEEYHQYFLSLYLKEGSGSSGGSEPEGAARRMQSATAPAEGSGSRRMGFEGDDAMREAVRGPEHVRASTR